MTHTRGAQKEKHRPGFHQVQPTFAVEPLIPTTTLVFLNENDPAKDKIVRKKAREWVNKNKERNKHIKKKQQDASANFQVQDVGSIGDHNAQLQKRKHNESSVIGSVLRAMGGSQFDPFNILPHVGRKYDHIVEFCTSSNLFCTAPSIGVHSQTKSCRVESTMKCGHMRYPTLFYRLKSNQDSFYIVSGGGAML
jgi:hypothetical protein